MSIKLMSAAWDLPIPSTEKMVLLCLCDHANDDGQCWPSMSRLAGKCSTTDRTIQRAIAKLVERGLLTVIPGGGRNKSNRYLIKIGSKINPDTVSPRHSYGVIDDINPVIDDINPDTVSPEPLRTIKKPSSNNIVRKPSDLDAEIWADWKRVRKKPVTATVMKAMQREADKLGWSLAQAITAAAENGWQGFKAEWVRQKPRGMMTADGWEIGM